MAATARPAAKAKAAAMKARSSKHWSTLPGWQGRGAGAASQAAATMQADVPVGLELFFCGADDQEREPGDVELYLAGIDGTSDSDIYVVGTDGHIFHWDGKAWRGVKSPTKAHLERVRCVDRGEVYICGYEGAFLRGNARDGFHTIAAIECSKK